ncbi:MAG TPA: hypothetical protein VJH75_04300 [Patescibacteria group bacterium]|nr:hypothetical protein [Patescibacteria group bacterium]
MKKILYIFLIALVVGFFVPSPAKASVSNWQTGVSVVPRWTTDYDSDGFRQVVDKIKAANANYVTLIIPLAQDNVWSTNVYNGWNTPTDQSLISGIQYIHSKGLQVNLKIHLESNDGQWRANINPGDRNAWFKSFGDKVRHYATIAKNNGVEEMTIGAELINMTASDANSTNTQNWNSLIGSIRQIYSGKLTYSANWGGPGWTDEKNRIGFWGSLDYIGISAYYPLPTGNKTVQAYKDEWAKINNNDIKNLYNRWNKPIIFTEIGYRSMDWAQWEPFNYWGGGSYDPDNQVVLYEALFSYWDGQSFMQGVHMWDWLTDPNAGGNGNTDFTSQNKPAEGTMRTWFGGSGQGGGGGGGDPGGGGTPTLTNFNITSNAPGTVTVNQGVGLNVAIKNNHTTAVNSTIVDVEVYTSGGVKVFQQFYENQSFTVGQSKGYNPSWTPTSAGEYLIVAGVFNNNWSVNYIWISNVKSIAVQDAPTGGGGSGTPTPPPTTGNLNIWWPTNNATVVGSQPFKVDIPNLDVTNYEMYWQVDGDRLNQMYNSNEDYPHKEVWVDVTSWTWKGKGPYRLTFVAKNSSGGTIGSSSVDIFTP